MPGDTRPQRWRRTSPAREGRSRGPPATTSGRTSARCSSKTPLRLVAAALDETVVQSVVLFLKSLVRFRWLWLWLWLCIVGVPPNHTIVAVCGVAVVGSIPPLLQPLQMVVIVSRLPLLFSAVFALVVVDEVGCFGRSRLAVFTRQANKLI